MIDSPTKREYRSNFRHFMQGDLVCDTLDNYKQYVYQNTVMTPCAEYSCYELCKEKTHPTLILKSIDNGDIEQIPVFLEGSIFPRVIYDRFSGIFGGFNAGDMLWCFEDFSNQSALYIVTEKVEYPIDDRGRTYHSIYLSRFESNNFHQRISFSSFSHTPEIFRMDKNDFFLPVSDDIYLLHNDEIEDYLATGKGIMQHRR